MVLYDIGDCFSIALALRIGLEGADNPLVIPVWGRHQQNKIFSMLICREEGLDLRAVLSCTGIYGHVKRLIEKSGKDMN
jgi:hypothetical protein